MSIQSANVYKAKAQEREDNYQRRMQHLCEPVPQRLYHVRDTQGTIISAVPLPITQAVTQYRGRDLSFIPV